MAVFERLPVQIRRAVRERMSQDEQVKMCFLAGSSMLSSRDNVPIAEVTSIDVTRTFINKILGQANMGLQIDRYKYLINNGGKKEIAAAAELIAELAHLENN